jgi:hypothetical protein
MSGHCKPRKELAGLAIAALTAVAALTASPAWAQFGGQPCTPATPCAVTAVTPGDYFDAIAQAVSDMDTVQLPPIVQSLTQGNGQANYVPDANTIATLDQALFPQNGINAQNFNTMFQGWVGCEPNCTGVEQGITNSTLSTYQAALQVAQQQEQELIGEGDNAGTIDQAVHNTTYVLTALQGIADLMAMDIEEHQYERQQLDTLITIAATHHAQDLNDSMQQLQTEIDTTPGEQQ